MIELYPAGQTDFSAHGVTLHPAACTVTYKSLARYDLDLTLPVMDSGPLAVEAALLEFGRIIYASVPPQHIPDINMGRISYWQIPDDAPADVPLYKSLGYWDIAVYQDWVPGRSYMQGDKVTWSGTNWQCTTGHGGLSTPPPENPNLWTEISRYKYVNGTVLKMLPPGSLITKLADFNSDYMRAADITGATGFIEIDKCQQVGAEEDYILPARTITHQPFVITEIRKRSQNGVITVHAIHLSYLLNYILMAECNLVSADPGTALAFIQGALMETWGGLMITNITGQTVTQDFSWKMAGDALLNPRSGLAAVLDARMIRDGKDIILLSNAQQAPVYAARYGVNLAGVDWRGNIDDLVTQVYPRAKNSDGTYLMLPGLYVETSGPVPFTRMQLLELPYKVGDTEEQTDGTTVTLTEEVVMQRMEDEAEARFTRDKCDQPKVTLDLDFIRMGDTAEYAQYKGMEMISPDEWLQVDHGPLDISVVIQMIGYTWDSILEMYQKTSFGDVRNYTGNSVTDWDLRAGAVTAYTLSEGLKKQLGV